MAANPTILSRPLRGLLGAGVKPINDMLLREVVAEMQRRGRDRLTVPISGVGARYFAADGIGKFACTWRRVPKRRQWRRAELVLRGNGVEVILT